VDRLLDGHSTGCAAVAIDRIDLLILSACHTITAPAT
jgi:hypothetical protein